MRPKTLTNTKTNNYKKLHIVDKHTTHNRAAHSSRCSQPLSNYQTPHPTTKMRRQHEPNQQARVLSQDPTVCRQPCPPEKPETFANEDFVVVHPVGATTATDSYTAHTSPIEVFFVVLLRKEVIQPHLPVRLPCYDFVPIADPTFDSSPHKG
jgi:hypothetical protein